MKHCYSKKIRQIFAMLLCVVTLVSVVPTPVYAMAASMFTTSADTGPLAVIYAASDFQATDSNGADNVAQGKNNMLEIMTQMRDVGNFTNGTVTGAIFCGDYSKNGRTYYNNGKDSTNVALNDAGAEAVAKVLNTRYGLTTNLNKLNDLKSDTSNCGDQVVLVQGNHDPANTQGLDKSGANDTEHYGVFVIHEDDFQWKQESTDKTVTGNTTGAKTAAQQTASELKAYLQAKVDTKDNRPIFIASHVPLHYTKRTTSNYDGDGMYSNLLFDVLNEYGKQLTIIFMFGHNHSSTYDDYLGGGAIFLPVGQKILVPQSSTDVSKAIECTLTFTYMNPGYVGKYEGGCTTGLSSTVFEVYEDRVVVSRFDKNGRANLKDKGINAPSGVSANEEVYAAGNKVSNITLRNTFKEELQSHVMSSGLMLAGSSSEVSVSGLAGKTYEVKWSSSNTNVANVYANTSNSMSANIKTVGAGSVIITAKITEVTKTKAVVDTKTLRMSLTVIDSTPAIIKPAGTYTYYVFDDSQMTSGWVGDKDKKYILVSQDRDAVTAGQFMAMQYTAGPDEAEGDYFGSEIKGNTWREVNTEPVTILQMPINGKLRFVVYDKGLSDEVLNQVSWRFDTLTPSGFNTQYTWYQIYPQADANIGHDKQGDRHSLMLSKGQVNDNLQRDDPDGDGIRMGKGVAHAWRMANPGNNVGLITYPHLGGNTSMNFAPYYDPIQCDFSVFSIANPDKTMGQRVYLYREESITLKSNIVGYISDLAGAVSVGVSNTAGTGDVIYIENDGVTTTVPVTVDMLSGNFDLTTPKAYEGLTVTYAGVEITKNYTLVVNGATTLMKNEGGKFRSTIYRLVNEMIPGRHYMIVDSNEAGEAHAMGAISKSTGTTAQVYAYNVLIQQFEVNGKNGLYIDSTRYSGTPDDPVAAVVGDKGDINAAPNTSDHKRARRLIWTPSIIFMAPSTSDTTYFKTSYVADDYYRFLISEFEDGRLELASSTSNDLVLKWGSNASNTQEWVYDANNSDYRYQGLRLDSDDFDNYRLFYNYECNRAKEDNKQFIMAGIYDEGGDLMDHVPLTRRTWIYELVDDIDVITARLNDTTGRATKDCTAAATTGDYVYVETFGTDGSVELVKVPVTVSMLSNGETSSANCSVDTSKAGTYSGLWVTYEGKVISKSYTLIVEEPTNDDYVEFPDEGAVRIDKQLDTSKFDYLNTGAAYIDLSVSGIPMQTGVDIVFILDTSSSMNDCIHNIDAGKKCSTCGTVGTSNSRLALLKKTLKAALQKLRTPVDGYAPDVDVAVATFNGYTPINSAIMLNPDKRADNDEQGEDTYIPTQANRDRMDSSVVALNFTDVTSLTNTQIDKVNNSMVLGSGTNYDRGMELAYDLLKAKQEENAKNGETRNQVVIFMSDGIPYQFNYVMGTPFMIDWAKFLKGNSADSSVTAFPADANANTLYKKYYNPNSTLWMAEAIKGDPSQKYKIINPDLQGSNDKIEYINGLGAKIYTLGMGIYSNWRIDEESCTTVLRGIASYNDDGTAKLFTNCKSADDFTKALEGITGTIKQAGNAVFTDQMGTYFDLITYNVKTVQTVDGETREISYKNADGTEKPMITLTSYPLYYRSDIGKTVDGVTVTEEMVGTRRPVDPVVIETVWFNDAGTRAVSDLRLGVSNIIEDGVICAMTFWYNTTDAAVMIDVDGDGEKETSLESECFYWKVGDIPQDELVLRYPVYLNGSMEGTRPAGSYDTNTHAELNYTNHLGNDCELSVPTPKLPWNQANVGYGFYLVDQNGTPIINQKSGTLGSFEQSVRVTQVVYQDFMLNSGAHEIAASEVVKSALPAGYELFDPQAKYEVSLNSGGQGHYGIYTGDPSMRQTTYVVGVGSSALTGDPTKMDSNKCQYTETQNYLTANTVVWFAVTATVSCVPDTVVIDFGLSVDIDVQSNDVMMGNYAKLEYVAPMSAVQAGYTQAQEETPDLLLWEYLRNLTVNQTPIFTGEQAEGNYGVLSLNKVNGSTDGTVRYTLNDNSTNKNNGMQMHDEEIFIYAIKYTGDVGTSGYYYSTVTVIPATNIYYEDSFLSYEIFNYETGERITEEDSRYKDLCWQKEGQTIQSMQAQDRPGTHNPSTLDANNIYGFDGAYRTMANYSMGSAMKLTVNEQVYGTATFTFWGTGFDVISLTDSTTGTIMVSVYKAEDYAANGIYGNTVKDLMVDTYYGFAMQWHKLTYRYDGKQWQIQEDEIVSDEVGSAGVSQAKPENPAKDATYTVYEYQWVPEPSSSSRLYQVPVMKVEDLEYAQYTAVIFVSYTDMLDHNPADASYDFYLDSIRVYDPANDGKDSATIRNAYLEDGECWPSYTELRNMIIKADTFDSLGKDDQISGAVFIDNVVDANKNRVNTIADYKSFGPNNEVYIAPGQAIAFDLNVTAWNAETESFDFSNIAAVRLGIKTIGGSAKVKIFNAEVGIDNAVQSNLTTATEMYYDMTQLNGKTVVIYNAGSASDAVISVTNIMVTYKSEPAQTEPQPAMLIMSRKSVALALSALEHREADNENEPTNPPTGDVSLTDVAMTGLIALLMIGTLLWFPRRKRKGGV